ncbi:glycosyltransferase family 4 protein [Pedobacter frigoris]|uniref:Glycosyltransferase family 4 protein n=1 Tax=Pedobacter frigoris TaxID=2571272 RepID=A0A4U1CML1_9SPHI|nr:glycosyltransferase family 4 protein [Pedobacter frigoris]TKC08643.1 glycosyltransferase family 4 protein [Pedobacter frigoris]
MKTIQLAIVVSHPIPYYTPVFRELAKSIRLKVFYTAGNEQFYDFGFQRNMQWDANLLQGYDHQFLTNTGRQHHYIHFFRIKNPDAIEAIKLFNPQHLLIYGWAYYSHLSIIRYFKNKVKISFRGDSNLLNSSSGLKHLFKKIALRWIYKHIDQAFFTGTHSKIYFKAYGLKESQLFFAPHAIDNQKFATVPHGSEKQTLRDKLGLQNDNILILFAGKFNPNKNPRLLLNAFLRIKSEHLILLFVGSGILEHKLKETVRKRQNSKVHFLPFQDQDYMPGIYQACDLFCMPSNHETWGLAINEAMAAGKAILASDHIGCAIDLIRESNGKTFKRGDITDLQEKLELLMVRKSDLTERGLASKSIIAKWDFNTQINNMLYAFK